MAGSHRFASVLGVLFLLAACQNHQQSISDRSFPIPAPLPAPVDRPVSYRDEIHPIIESKCLSCHSCYDAPCQLKLESAEGVLRGVFMNPFTEARAPKPYHRRDWALMKRQFLAGVNADFTRCSNPQTNDLNH